MGKKGLYYKWGDFFNAQMNSDKGTVRNAEKLAESPERVEIFYNY